MVTPSLTQAERDEIQALPDADERFDKLVKEFVLVGPQLFLLDMRRSDKIRARLLASDAAKDARIEKACDLIIEYGGIDGDHHKTWVIDQVFRALTGDDYERRVAEAKAGEDGPDTYGWDEGTPP